MREIRPSGSEGGVAANGHPYPYPYRLQAAELPAGVGIPHHRVEDSQQRAGEPGVVHEG